MKSFYEEIWEKNHPEEVQKLKEEAEKKATAEKVKKMQEEAKRLAEKAQKLNSTISKHKDKNQTLPP
jgi:predicted nuclease with TOPRIM domain